MRKYNYVFDCPGCQDKNKVESTKLSFVDFKTEVIQCALCESRIFLRVRRKFEQQTAPKKSESGKLVHEKLLKLEIRLVKFIPSPSFIEAMEEKLKEEAEQKAENV